MQKLVSIIIPTKVLDKNVDRCVKACIELPQEKEILVITDSICPGFPARKRNLAMHQAKGDIFAFIDSDAYPAFDWLKQALYWLQCYPAVCGPGILPPDAPYLQQVADKVHQWLFCPYRVLPKDPKIVPWHPTFNLIVKKEYATPFDEYLTGEDDKFCLRIREGIYYHPDIKVYHDRRPAFKPLWKQFGTYATHKGCFVGIAFVAWVTTIWVYARNWIRGFVRRKP